MTAPGTRPRALLDDPRAAGLVNVVVALGLFAATGLDDPPPWQVVHGAATIGFCVWTFAPRRRRPRVAQALALASLGGALVAPGGGLLLVVGATVLVRSVRRWWLATTAVILALGAAAGLADGHWASPSTWPVAALTVLLTILDRVATATALPAATVFRGDVDQDRQRLGGELRAQIGRTLCAARQDVEAAIDAASASTLAPDDHVVEQLASLRSLIDHGIDQLGRLSTEPVAATLPHELRAAQEVCERLGILAVVSADPVADRAVSEACALVLREAVTNMLRHAAPTRCVIAVRCSAHEIVLSVTNDGASRPAPGSAQVGAGSGQRRWRQTAGHLGARVSTGVLDGGRYHVVVRFPTRSSRPAGSGSGHVAQLIGWRGARWGFGS
ncbi:MAG: sensor histidine kinase [Dermatophilaceae bacterium]